MAASLVNASFTHASVGAERRTCALFTRSSGRPDHSVFAGALVTAAAFAGSLVIDAVALYVALGVGGVVAGAVAILLSAHRADGAPDEN